MSESSQFRSLASVGRSLPPIRKSAVSPDVAAFLSGTDLDQDQRGARLVNPYAESAWIYSAVSILAQSVAMIPFRISRVGGGKAKRVRAFRSSADPAHRQFCRRALGETIVDSGPVVDLFDHPHPTMDSQMFWETVVTWLALRGEFFVLPLDAGDGPVDLKDRNPRVERLVCLTPDLFWHVVVGYSLEAWRYTGSPLISPIPSEMLLPSEVIYSRTPNPYLFWRGLSPLIVALAPAQTDFAGEQFQKGLWVNNADTGVVVTTDQQATKEQQAAILSALRERKRKAGTADRPLFLWGGAKIEKPTLSMMDMQFLETRKFLRQEIFAIFKVPETLAGFTSDLNDGGAGGSLDATKGSFVESTVGAICTRLEAAVDPVIKTFGEDLMGWFDIDSLPIMQAQRRMRWGTAKQMFDLGVTLNDINRNLDLGLPEYKGSGDINYLPFNLQNANAETEPPPSDLPPATPPKEGDEEDQGEGDGDKDKEKANPFSRLGKMFSSLAAAPAVRKPDTKLIWESHVNSRRKTVKMMQGKVGKVLTEFRVKTLAKLNTVHLEKSASESQRRSLIDLIFSANAFGEALNGELKNPIFATLNLAGTELNEELGNDNPWQIPPKAAKDYLAKRSQQIMGVGGTVREQLNTSLQEGLNAGETTEELAGRVKSVFTNLNGYEAKRVALTETNMAYNSARHLAMTDAGVEYKAWLSSHGPHVREAHARAEEDYIDSPIPVDEPFEVGGEQLMFPGDDSLGASPGNIINCQCIQLAAQKTAEDEKTMTFKVYGLGILAFSKTNYENS